MTATEVAPDRSDDERAATGRRAERLESYAVALEPEDRQDIVHRIARRHETSEAEAKPTKIKYVPDSCHDCGAEWGAGIGDDPGHGYRRLSAYVWRCTDCGRVQMQTHPSHRQTTL